MPCHNQNHKEPDYNLQCTQTADSYGHQKLQTNEIEISSPSFVTGNNNFQSLSSKSEVISPSTTVTMVARVT